MMMMTIMMMIMMMLMTIVMMIMYFASFIKKFKGKNNDNLVKRFISYPINMLYVKRAGYVRLFDK